MLQTSPVMLKETIWFYSNSVSVYQGLGNDGKPLMSRFETSTFNFGTLNDDLNKKINYN